MNALLMNQNDSAATANSLQVGGEHYRTAYQHWDFVSDLAIPYLPACAIKYVTRYNKKNGKQDLQKAMHFLTKMSERADCQSHRAAWVFASKENSEVKKSLAEVADLLVAFLDATFGPESEGYLDSGEIRPPGYARDAIRSIVFPFVELRMEPGIDYPEFLREITVHCASATSHIQLLMNSVYPESTEGSEASPEYVNQDR